AKAGAESTSVKIYDRETIVSFDGIVSAGGRVTINLMLSNDRLENMGDQSCYLGLTSMAYGHSSDPLARVVLLEKVTLYTLGKYVRLAGRSLSLVV
ncbi:MAG TPA: hypothetical protein VME69_12880, partial [Methylocella sp.]|nr:hypothetical protein [Methylocella sp.]